MTLTKRALLYLTRKKSRSILLILLIFVMSSFILIGAALMISANKEIKEMKNNLGNSFVLKEPIGQDHIENYAGYKGGLTYIGPQVTQDMIDTILNIDGVTGYFPTFGESVWVDLALRAGVYAEWEEEKYYEIDDEITKEELTVLEQTTTAIVCSSGELQRDFRIGALDIVDGRNIRMEDHHTAVISEYLAEKNGLSVGDTFGTKVCAYYEDTPATTWGESIDLEVVGTFHLNFEEEGFSNIESAYAENFVFIDLDTGTELVTTRCDTLGQEYDDQAYEFTFFVDDPENLEQIMKKVRESVELDEITMFRDNTAYKASVKPLRLISFFAFLLILVGVIGCAGILFLVLSMWVRSRKHEIGILLSIGISKRKIVAQMLLECIIVSVIGLILTIVLSGVMINGCCRAAGYLTKPDAGEATYSVTYSFEELEPPIEKVSSEAIQLDYDDSARDMALLVLVVCVLSSGSVLVASYQVLHIKPKELLQMM